MKLKGKIFFGFLILALMLFIAGVWSAYQLSNISTSVSEVISKNYESMHSARVMIEGLEREDSGILLLHMGNWEKGREILQNGDTLFTDNLRALQSNNTSEEEDKIIKQIRVEYFSFKSLWQKPIVGTKKEGDLDWYFKEVHSKFQKIKDKVNEIIKLNEETIYATAVEMSQKENSTVMPGIIASVSALGFVFIFTYLINYFVISPIVNLSKRIKLFIEKRVPIGYEIETRDELYDLENSIRILSSLVESQESKKQ